MKRYLLGIVGALCLLGSAAPALAHEIEQARYNVDDHGENRFGLVQQVHFGRGERGEGRRFPGWGRGGEGRGWGPRGEWRRDEERGEYRRGGRGGYRVVPPYAAYPGWR